MVTTKEINKTCELVIETERAIQTFLDYQKKSDHINWEPTPDYYVELSKFGQCWKHGSIRICPHMELYARFLTEKEILEKQNNDAHMIPITWRCEECGREYGFCILYDGYW